MGFSMKKDNRKNIGSTGEKLVETELANLGYKIIAKNLRLPQFTRAGEIDVLALNPKKNGLLLCEVKTRSFSICDGRVPVISQNQYRRIQNARKWIQVWLEKGSLEEVLVNEKLNQLLKDKVNRRTQVQVVVFKVDLDVSKVEIILPSW